MRTKFKTLLILAFIACFCIPAKSTSLLIPMDASQQNHLKAYGIAYWVLKQEVEMHWLLNYRGGSFLVKHLKPVEDECLIRGVSYQIIADAQANGIMNKMASADVNMEAVNLEKAPRVAVYSPKDKAPWDDAVTLVLSYAEIPYDVVYDEEIMSDKLPLYDWLHLHHEDFTGQYGRFWYAYRGQKWYQDQQQSAEDLARRLALPRAANSHGTCECPKAPRIRAVSFESDTTRGYGCLFG